MKGTIKYFLYICFFFFTINTKVIAGGWVNILGEWNLTSFGYSYPRLFSLGYIFEDFNLGLGTSIYGKWCLYGQPFYQKDWSGKYVYCYEEGNLEQKQNYSCYAPLSLYIILLPIQLQSFGRLEEMHLLHLYFHSSYPNQFWVKKGWLKEEDYEIPIVYDFGIGFTLSSIEGIPFSLKVGCLTITEHKSYNNEIFFPKYSTFYVGIAVEIGGIWVYED